MIDEILKRHSQEIKRIMLEHVLWLLNTLPATKAIQQIEANLKQIELIKSPEDEL